MKDFRKQCLIVGSNTKTKYLVVRLRLNISTNLISHGSATCAMNCSHCYHQADGIVASDLALAWTPTNISTNSTTHSIFLALHFIVYCTFTLDSD